MWAKIADLLGTVRFFYRAATAATVPYEEVVGRVRLHLRIAGWTRVYDLARMFPGTEALEKHPGTPVLSIARLYGYLARMEESGLVVGEMRDYEGTRRLFYNIPKESTDD